MNRKLITATFKEFLIGGTIIAISAVIATLVALYMPQPDFVVFTQKDIDKLAIVICPDLRQGLLEGQRHCQQAQGKITLTKEQIAACKKGEKYQ